MATQVNVYTPFKQYLLDGTIDLDSDPLKVMLLTSGYTFDAAHGALADVSTHEVAGTGYTAGGELLTGVAVSLNGSNQAVLNCNNISWTGATITARWALLYANVTRNSVADPLIAAILLDDTPADVSSSNMDFTLQMPADGLIKLG